MKGQLIYFVCVSLFIIGCAASSSKTFGPDGKEAYVISCRGDYNSWGDCYEIAGKICGAKGYREVNKSAYPRSMTIQCKE